MNKNLKKEIKILKKKIKDTNKVYKDILQEIVNDLKSKDLKSKILGLLIEKSLKRNLDKHDLDSMIFEYTQKLKENLIETEEIDEVEAIVFSLLASKEIIIAEHTSEKDNISNS